jgi:hypothetical protein
MCGAHEHHQNGGAEGLFRRANSLCGLYLASSAQFGDEYWDYAYVHANVLLQYFAPTKDSLTPMERWQHAYPSERIHTDSSFLQAWGSKCFSYNADPLWLRPSRKNVSDTCWDIPCTTLSRPLHGSQRAHEPRERSSGVYILRTLVRRPSVRRQGVSQVCVRRLGGSSVQKLATNATRQRANAKQGQGESFPPDGIVRPNRTKRDRARDTSVKMRRALVDNMAVREACAHGCAPQRRRSNHTDSLHPRRPAVRRQQHHARCCLTRGNSGRQQSDLRLDATATTTGTYGRQI